MAKGESKMPNTAHHPSSRSTAKKFGLSSRKVSIWSRIVLMAISLQAISANAAYPDRPIKWIVPSAASGASDTTVRIVADQLSKRLGQPVIIDNRPGASGAIGLDLLAKSAPDGYTIGTINITNFVMNRQLRPNLPFDVDRDFIPLVRLSTQSNLLVVNPSLPINDVNELVAYSKAHPSSLFYGSAGAGSSQHIAMEFLKQITGASLTHIPYKSSPAAGIDLMGNRVQVMLDNLSTLAPNVKSGKIRALALTAPKRSALLPDVPTFIEAGFPSLQMTVWSGVATPNGVDPEITKMLSDEILAVLKLPSVIASLKETGYEPDGLRGSDFVEFIKQENTQWGDVIHKANIEPD